MLISLQFVTIAIYSLNGQRHPVNTTNIFFSQPNTVLGLDYCLNGILSHLPYHTREQNTQCCIFTEAHMGIYEREAQTVFHLKDFSDPG